MINIFCGILKLYFKTIFVILIIIPVILLIGFGVISLLVGIFAASPLLIAAIAFLGIILFIPILFVIGFIKALLE